MGSDSSDVNVLTQIMRVSPNIDAVTALQAAGRVGCKVNARETNTTAFNPGLFVTNSAQTFAYHIRTFSTTFPNVRADGINQLDLSMLKRFNINEKTYFQLRAEAFNLMNHAAFSAPNVAATNASFGLITAQANRSRQLQFGVRFVF